MLCLHILYMSYAVIELISKYTIKSIQQLKGHIQDM